MNAEPQLSRARTYAIVATIWLVSFCTTSQFLMVAPILPRMHVALDVDVAVLGTLSTGYAGAMAVVAILSGPLADRFGRRNILRIGTLSMALALLLHGLATTFPLLLGLRILTGMASGVLTGASIAYIGDVIPYERRGWALGWTSSGLAFGQIAGVPLGTVLADWGGFQMPFVLFGGVLLLAFAAAVWVLVATPVTNAKLDLRGALAIYRSLLTNRASLSAVVASMLLMLSVGSYIVFQPTWLETTFGATPRMIASIFFVGGLANAVAGPLAGRLSDRVGRKILVVGAGAGLTITMALTPLIPSLIWIYAIFFVNMMLVGGRIGPFNAWLTGLVPASERGTLMNLALAMGQVGFGIGAGIAAWTYAHAGYASNAWTASAFSAMAAMVIGALIPERKPVTAA